MYLRNLTVTNWKCFLHEQQFTFSPHREIITWPNGTGKTSLFEAIIFGLWGKLPSGFTQDSIRNTLNAPCSVIIEFTQGEDFYCFKRQFGNNILTIAQVFCNDKLICESVKDAYAYMENILSYDFACEFWTDDLISSTSSQIKFVNDVILKNKINIPLRIGEQLRSAQRANFKIIKQYKNSIESNQEHNILDITKKLKAIKGKLKKQDNTSPREYSLARVANESAIKLEKNFKNFIPVNSQDCIIYQQYYGKNQTITQSINIELNKQINKFTGLGSIAEINKYLTVSAQMQKCVICNALYTPQIHQENLQLLNNSSVRNQQLINQGNSILNVLNKYTQEDIKRTNEYMRLTSDVAKCPQYKDILNHYDEKNKQLWNEYDNLNHQMIVAQRLKEQEKIYNTAVQDNEIITRDIIIVRDYIEKMSAYAIDTITTKASDILMQISDRYQGIALDKQVFQVIVQDENFSLKPLPINVLSSGEKTLCIIALIFAIHDTICMDLPLLFDETFSCLDAVNLDKLQSYIQQRSQDTQIFIITHDASWKKLC